MRLIVNLSTLGPRPTGLGVYAARSARAICERFEADVIASHPIADARSTIPSPPNVALLSSRAAALRRWLWLRSLRELQSDLIYCPTHHGIPAQRNQVLTVHDLIALHFPRQHPAQYLYFRHVLPRQLEACRAVFTVSEVTRRDIHHTYGYPLDAIRVVPNGVDTDIYKPSSDTNLRIGSDQPYLLMVGAGYEHKNVQEVLAMAGLWRNRYRLKVASCRGKYRARLEKLVRSARLEDRVEFLPYLSQSELVCLYQGAAALLYPSKWEGFGIPPLEALACGTDVIASDIPVHREVLTKYARFVRLGSESDWAAAFDSLSQTQGQVASLSDPLHPVRRFTWEHSARKLESALLAVEPRLQKK